MISPTNHRKQVLFSFWNILLLLGGTGNQPAVSSLSTIPIRSITQAYSNTIHILEHLFSPPQISNIKLEDIVNVRIPVPTTGPAVDEILAYSAKPSGSDDNNNKQELPLLILIHEFFGLNPSIVEKADALAEELHCHVVAPDTFRGQSTTFIPKAIWLALSTPTSRVNDDLGTVCDYYLKDDNENEKNNGKNKPKLAVMGFCYGGGKAIQFTTQCRRNAATVIFYGKPVTDVKELAKLNGPVCGIYGRDDIQFPMPLIDEFQSALNNAGVTTSIEVYHDVGHAFWKDMEQIHNQEQPQTTAYEQCTGFLKDYFDGDIQ